jgi:chaperonin cofactor prefoldin
MNCLLEALASMWLAGRRRVMTEPPEEEVMTAQEGLEQCRRNMEARERELQSLMHRLGEEALVKRKVGETLAARSKLLERKRVHKRLERLRHGLDLVDTQLDAIKTSELDKEIMLTLKASTSAMRKAGITLGVQEVENVMSELDEQMREVQDVTSALSNPLLANSQAIGGMLSGPGVEDADLDAELDLLEAMGQDYPDPSFSSRPVRPVPVPVNSIPSSVAEEQGKEQDPSCRIAVVEAGAAASVVLGT